MQESEFIELDGKRVGCRMDRKRKTIWVDRLGGEFHHQTFITIDGESFTVNYKPEPVDQSSHGPGCCCGDPSCYPCC